MNTFVKFCPNVFVAKCENQYEKGETITLETKYGKEVECIVFNEVMRKDGFFYYSIVRVDGFDSREFARRKAEKLENASINAINKSNAYWSASNEGREFLALGEPIKIGHHSEKRHRALIERNHNRMSKAVEFEKQAEAYEQRASYWKAKENDINLSMPESLEFYEFKLEQAKNRHEGIKNGSIPKEHSYTLTYAKKAVNEAKKNLDLAIRLWGDN